MQIKNENDKNIIIKYNQLNNFPEINFICIGENPNVILLSNGTYLMAFDNETIYISYSFNGINWSKPKSITNEPGHPIEWALGPFIHEFKNGSILITYNKGGPDNNNYAVFSNDGRNWSNVYITNVTYYDDDPWDDIDPPEYMNEPIGPFSSLLELDNGTYIIARGENFSPSDIGYTDLVITYSENGKDWTLPIRITNHSNGYAPDMVQQKDGDFLILFDKLHKIYSLSISFSNITNTSGPYEVIADYRSQTTIPSFESILFITSIGIIIRIMRKHKIKCYNFQSND
jgi:hypothetical protein